MTEYIADQEDPRVVLRAWINAWPMGGWPCDDPDALRRAVLLELEKVGPEPIGGWEIEIEKVT